MPEPSQPAAEKAVPEQVGEEPPQSEQIPSGLKAIFISGPTQQLFQCVTDSDVSEENPFKLISKAAILEDFKKQSCHFRFSPCQKGRAGKFEIRTPHKGQICSSTYLSLINHTS